MMRVGTMRDWRIFVIAFSLGCVLGVPTGATGQERVDLLPRLGETTKEFEARKEGLTAPAREDSSVVTLPADRNGHFFVDAAVNGTPIRMMVDTGATLVAFSEQDARQVGIRLSPSDFTQK